MAFSLVTSAEQSVSSLPVLLVVRDGMTVGMTGQQEDPMSVFSDAEIDLSGLPSLEGRGAWTGS